MIIQDVINHLEELAPLAYAEDFDNVGLLVGNGNTPLTGVLVTLDTLENVVDEAISENCNMIVSFHPIIFKGLKKLNGSNYVERVILKAVKNDIAIYAIHTALDNSLIGVNDIICNKIGLVNKQILNQQKQTIKKLITYVPNENADELRLALFKAGAGNIGNYDNCSFNIGGTGTYKGNEASNPVIGQRGEYHEEKETQLSITFQKHLEQHVIHTLFANHPYEEVAYETTTLDNVNQHIGIGMVGDLPHEMEVEEFLQMIKEKMKVSAIRHSALVKKSVKRIAVLGGSGSFAINAAKKAKADVFITADLKYHDFFSADGSIILADIGHYESEQFTKNFLADYLSKKITNFAPSLPVGRVVLSTINTNPVKYL